MDQEKRIHGSNSREIWETVMVACIRVEKEKMQMWSLVIEECTTEMVQEQAGVGPHHLPRST